MGLFNFFKPKKSELNVAVNTAHEILNKYFPKGEKDMEAGTQEILSILNNKVTKSEAKNIFIKTVCISRLSENFDKEKLKLHLEGYCIQHFNEKQIEQLKSYLSALMAAMLLHSASPSEVWREGDGYFW